MNNSYPPFFKLKIDIDNIYQYADEFGYLKVNMFSSKKDPNKYYFVLDEYEWQSSKNSII